MSGSCATDLPAVTYFAPAGRTPGLPERSSRSRRLRHDARLLAVRRRECHPR